MKHLIIILVLLFSIGIWAEDLTSDATFPNTKKDVSTFIGDLNKEGIDLFLQNCVGMNIAVSMNTVDTTINGRLIGIYKDGIYLKTAFNNYIYIMKSSIAYIRITGFNIKK